MQNSNQTDVTDVVIKDEVNDSSVDPAILQNQKTYTYITYGVYLLGMLIGILPAIAALVMAYVKRGEFEATYSAHLSYLIRTFWWSSLWVVIGLITSFIFIGFVIILGACIWSVYRIVRGFIHLHDGKAPHIVT